MDNLFLVLWFLSFLAIIIGLIKPSIVVRWGEKRGRRQVFKYYGIAFIVFFTLFAVALPDVEQEVSSDEMQQVTQTVEKKEEINIEKEKEERAIKEILNFSGKLDLKVVDNKIIAAVTSNVPDGGLFELSIMNGKFEVLNDFLPIKDGVVSKEFTIPDEWGMGYLTGMAFFKFNSESNPQPKNITEIYGERGGKMTGDNIVEISENEKNGKIEAVTIAYPSEMAVKNELNKLFLGALNEIIDTSNGIIIRIQPHYEDGDWTSVAVTVSDSWYYSQEYEKERFAEQYADIIEKLIRNAGKVKSDDYVFVYYYDQYQKELASPKTFGGYKIKR